MRWVFVQFSEAKDGTHIKCHTLHPMMAKHRLLDVCLRYGVTIRKVEKSTVAFIDGGGMLMHNSPRVRVVLGKDRFFECWEHQASWVLDKIKQGLEEEAEKFPTGQFVRYGSWPEHMIFMSVRDAKKVVVGLEAQVKHEAEQDYREKTLNVLVNANAKAHPGLNKAQLKADLLAHRARGQKLVKSDQVN